MTNARGSATKVAQTAPILIVDDEASVRALFVRVLRGAGYETLEAADGLKALQIIEDRPVALLLVDSTMPALDGPGLIRILRNREATQTLPIILITAHASLEARIDGLQHGADDFLAKPVAMDELIARVHAQLRSQVAWGEVAKRELSERQVLTAALRQVRVDPIPELTAQSIVHALSEMGDGVSVALLRPAPMGRMVPLAAEGQLASVYQPGVAIPASTARALLARAEQGPWIQRVREPGPGDVAMRDGAGLDAAYLPLGPDDRLVGLLIIALDADPAVARPTTRIARWLPLLVEAADLVTTLLRPGLEASANLADARAAIERVITRREFVPHFQPIVRLLDRVVLGYEGLTRFTNGEPPDVLFAEAGRLGLGRALEIATLEATVMAATRLPTERSMSLNVSPQLLGDPDLDALLLRADRKLILELTEHDQITDYDAVRGRIERLHAPVRIAVDDAGSGYASMRHILALRPSLVKLDVSLVRGIDTDPAKQALIAGFVHFARETGCELIGEAVETEPEYHALLRLGVHQGQGHLFGRPAPAPG